jgi:hypothetical protein
VWLKQKSACFASAKPWVPIPVPPKKKSDHVIPLTKSSRLPILRAGKPKVVPMAYETLKALPSLSSLLPLRPHSSLLRLPCSVPPACSFSPPTLLWSCISLLAPRFCWPHSLTFFRSLSSVTSQWSLPWLLILNYKLQLQSPSPFQLYIFFPIPFFSISINPMFLIGWFLF